MCTQALYNLGIAQTKLGQYAEAKDSLASAKKLLGSSDNASAARLEAAGFALKKAQWEAADSRRVAARTETLQRLLEFASERGNGAEGESASDAAEWRGHKQQLQLLMAEEEARQIREVPDWLCCKITMDVFRDPVITPDGISFDKQVLLDHLAKNQTDPFTRQPLTSADLRPNYALKEACDEFLRDNPWAYPSVQATGLW
jgi:STIP1 family protein 1